MFRARISSRLFGAGWSFQAEHLSAAGLFQIIA
jgi:hypothetical protein